MDKQIGMRCIHCPLCHGTGKHRILYELEEYYELPPPDEDRKWWYYEDKFKLEVTIMETGETDLTKTSDNALTLDLQRLASMVEAEMPTQDIVSRGYPPQKSWNSGLSEPPHEFFIALRNKKVEAVPNGILSYIDFGTTGYIPVASSSWDAVQALFNADHGARIAYPADYQMYRMFNPFAHANYIKSNKLRPGNYKLFFEVGLPGVTRDREPIGHTRLNDDVWMELPVTWEMEVVKQFSIG